MSGPKLAWAAASQQLRSGLKAYVGDPRLLTAVHEAGHAIRATRAGLVVTEVSVAPTATALGHMSDLGLHRPEEGDCEPDSPRWREDALVLLAGDRAGRLLEPESETALGGDTSDYQRCERLVEAVYAKSSATEGVLLELAHELDDWLCDASVVTDLLAVALLLLDKHTISGEELRAATSGGCCGAVGPEGQTCCLSAHRFGDHWHEVGREMGCIPIRERWDGWFPTRKAAGRPTARLLRVRRAEGWEPQLPAPKRGLTHEEFEELRRRSHSGPPLSDHERSRMARFMAARTRGNQRAALPPPPEAPLELAPIHAQDCPAPEELLEDDAGPWCPACCYEPERPANARYLLVYRRWVEGEALTVLASDALRTSQEARDALRLFETRGLGVDARVRRLIAADRAG